MVREAEEFGLIKTNQKGKPLGLKKIQELVKQFKEDNTPEILYD